MTLKVALPIPLALVGILGLWKASSGGRGRWWAGWWELARTGCLNAGRGGRAIAPLGLTPFDQATRPPAPR